MGAKRIRYAETAELMDEALLILLKKKPYDRVTVTDICAKAGVNRSTFYLHYDTIDDLLEETLESAIEKLVAKYPSIIRPVEQCEEEELHLYTPDYLMPYLAFARENRDLLILASKHKKLFHTDDTFSLLFNRLFNPILARFDVPERDRRYVIAFFMSGIHAIIISWLEGGCQESDEQICELIYKYVKR